MENTRSFENVMAFARIKLLSADFIGSYDILGKHKVEIILHITFVAYREQVAS